MMIVTIIIAMMITMMMSIDLKRGSQKVGSFEVFELTVTVVDASNGVVHVIDKLLLPRYHVSDAEAPLSSSQQFSRCRLDCCRLINSQHCKAYYFAVKQMTMMMMTKMVMMMMMMMIVTNMMMTMPKMMTMMMTTNTMMTMPNVLIMMMTTKMMMTKQLTMMATQMMMMTTQI